MNPRKSTLLRAAALVLALPLLLGACASDEPVDRGSESSAPGAGNDAPSPDLAEDRTWTGTLVIGGEAVEISLDGAAAPQAVASFVTLARDGFFDDVACHRLTTRGIYVLQCGDPSGDGTGGPGYSFGPVENDPADGVYAAGTIAMARMGNDGDSNGSQFFLVYQESTIPADSAGGYTVFGEITGGLDVVQAIAAGGVEGGGSDGPPATAAVIGSVAVE
jgi:peptidyl-prolyl cis-trans isomerase B (cyclophilin B)